MLSPYIKIYFYSLRVNIKPCGKFSRKKGPYMRRFGEIRKTITEISQVFGFLILLPSTLAPFQEKWKEKEKGLEVVFKCYIFHHVVETKEIIYLLIVLINIFCFSSFFEKSERLMFSLFECFLHHVELVFIFSNYWYLSYLVIYRSSVFVSDQ